MANWLPADFVAPGRVELPTGDHVRPIRADDVAIDYPAVMDSRQSLWAKYGEAWGWPPETMTFDEDRQDLARHEAEIERHESFNSAVMNADETALLGCVYIDPPDRPDTDAEVSWWVIDTLAASTLAGALDEFVPRWLVETWGFKNPSFALQ